MMICENNLRRREKTLLVEIREHSEKKCRSFDHDDLRLIPLSHLYYNGNHMVYLKN